MSGRNMFQKSHIDGLFGELNEVYRGTSESEKLHRDAHLAIAYFDAGQKLPSNVDERVVALIHKYGPQM